MADCGLILLAAGGSARMGAAKQLLPYRGRPLVRHAAETAVASQCRPVIVVLGSEAERIRPALADLPIHIVENPRWPEGVGTSIRAGIDAADGVDLDGVVLALADQALITAAMIDRLLAAHRESAHAIVASRYAGTVGVPVFFAHAFFPHLRALAPDHGCKGIIVAHAAQVRALDCPEAEVDVDTPRDYERLRV